MPKSEPLLPAPGSTTQRAFTILGLVLAVGSGCAASTGPNEPRSASAASERVQPLARPARVPNFSEHARNAELNPDRNWEAASNGDVLDLVLLARAEGATGLLQRAELGGAQGVTALRALPYADDRELALRPLCSWILLDSARIQPPVLDAVVGIVSTPLEPVEALDPGALGLCDRQLARAERAVETPEIRDAVQSARDLIHKRLIP